MSIHLSNHFDDLKSIDYTALGVGATGVGLSSLFSELGKGFVLNTRINSLAAKGVLQGGSTQVAQALASNNVVKAAFLTSLAGAAKFSRPQAVGKSSKIFRVLQEVHLTRKDLLAILKSIYAHYLEIPSSFSMLPDRQSRISDVTADKLMALSQSSPKPSSKRMRDDMLAWFKEYTSDEMNRRINQEAYEQAYEARVRRQEEDEDRFGSRYNYDYEDRSGSRYDYDDGCDF